MIAIIDYGLGNLGSIRNMLKKIGVDSVITHSVQEIEHAEKLILPGVGAFDTGMEKLESLGLTDVLHKKVKTEKIPVLGICLGMQLITKGSEEGARKGLGWVDAFTMKFEFPSGSEFKIPNMGWNYIRISDADGLFQDMYEHPKFYFVHSYYVKCENEQDAIAFADYGLDYCCSFRKENIYGVQFHPEKSHKYGMKLLRNFAGI